MSNEERRTELIEALAAIEHERWGDWQSYFMGKLERLDDGRLAIPIGYEEALRKLIDTHYADLSEPMKEADRREVGRYLPLVDEYADKYVPEMRT